MISGGTALGLPSTVLVGRTMPKKAFYEHLKTTAPVKAEFTQFIEHIELIASIKESSLHIPATKEIVEIDVLGLWLRSEENADQAFPYQALDLIARSISNKLLFACFRSESCKFLIKWGQFYETPWMLTSEAELRLHGSTLEELWWSFCSQVVFGIPDSANFPERLANQKKEESLITELNQINKKRKTEKQVAKRNALFDRKREIEQELKRLKGMF